MKFYFILAHICFSMTGDPNIHCKSAYWPQEYELNECLNKVPQTSIDIRNSMEKQGLKIEFMQINCIKSNTIES
tara:strand:+ start:992 stop:1213 length:222 start_codon:yes stop_codon:yes gene_type:complete